MRVDAEDAEELWVARIRARWTVRVRGVYVCADAKALTRTNRSSAQV